MVSWRKASNCASALVLRLPVSTQSMLPTVECLCAGPGSLEIRAFGVVIRGLVSLVLGWESEAGVSLWSRRGGVSN